MLTEIERALAGIEEALPGIEWRRAEGPPGHEREASFMEGAGPSGWRFTLCAFDIASQGFPPGTLGYDGTGVKGASIVRLPRELAEKAFKLAEAALR